MAKERQLTLWEERTRVSRQSLLDNLDITSPEFRRNVLEILSMVGIPEVDVKKYARSRWLLNNSGEDLEDLTPVQIRQILAAYSGLGCLYPIKFGTSEKPLIQFTEEELRRTLRGTKRLCNQYLDNFSRKYHL